MSDLENQELIKRLNIAFENSNIESKKQIEKELGVSYAGVMKWFRTGNIGTENAKKLSKLLGCDYSWLLTGAGESNQQNNFDPDPFLVECVKFVVRLPGIASMDEDEVNELIKNVYKDGFDAKKINPKLISHLM